MTILPLLGGPWQSLLCRVLDEIEGCNYRESDIGPGGCKLSDVGREEFWATLPLEDIDIVVVHPGASGQSNASSMANAVSHAPSVLMGSPFPAAVVVLVPEESNQPGYDMGLENVDGFIKPLSEPDELRRCFEQSLVRCRRRLARHQRYHKIRRLCRDANQKRRVLRDKVDLLCNDLVGSNKQLAVSLKQLWQVCTFQDELIGQFDLDYLLHKSLAHLKNLLPDAGAALYLCPTDRFEAHIACTWYDHYGEISDLERALKQVAVSRVLSRPVGLLIDDAQKWQGIGIDHRVVLDGLSVLAEPLTADEDVFGVALFYRQAEKPFLDRDANTIRPFLGPLARAAKALRTLDACIAPMQI